MLFQLDQAVVHRQTGGKKFPTVAEPVMLYGNGFGQTSNPVV